MADSTPYVLAAGAMVCFNKMIISKDMAATLKAAVGTGAAAIATAGIDKAFPGMGVSLGWIMVIASLLKWGVPTVQYVAYQGKITPGAGVPVEYSRLQQNLAVNDQLAKVK